MEGFELSFVYNNQPIQGGLFGAKVFLDPRFAEMLENSWAHVFRENVFPIIDESLFEPLYSTFGRPNFPVNVLVSLEIIKHMQNLNDKELLERFAFDLQVAYAVGLENVGELYLAERSLYEFRSRVYRYTLENPESDLIFEQFQKLTQHFLELANTDTSIQRMDSFQIASNIKIGGRLSLAVDVLIKGVRALPKELLTEELRPIVESGFSRRILYHARSESFQTRLSAVLDKVEKALLLAQENDLGNLEEIQLLSRFLDEQTEIDSETKTRRVKDNKEIKATSLQSAHDPDATFRAKGTEKHHGYVGNITETCSRENVVQFITDYDLNPNSKADKDMLEERVPVIKAFTDVDEINTDGGYYSSELETGEVKVHFTDMTGSKENPDKTPLAKFEYNEDNSEVLSCPLGHTPLESMLDENRKLIVRFDRQTCLSCPQQESCRVRIQKHSAVLRTNQGAVATSQDRAEIFDPENRRETLCLRAGIEGTGSALINAEGAGRLRVRGIVKCENAFGLKVIARNFKQFCLGLYRISKQEEIAITG